MLTPNMNIRAVLAIVAVVAFIILPNLVDFLMEWFWFGAIGYRDVFVTSLRARASLGAFILGVAFLALYGNLWIALSSICGLPSRPSPARTSSSGGAEAAPCSRRWCGGNSCAGWWGSPASSSHS